MVTFNVDSLDFIDDEEARFGADTDFAARFDSANSRLELEDLTNATVGYIPQNVGTDLVGGKFAETVSEGKALADDGNVYDTIQEAENAASSWVKVGPGDFRESVTIDTAGLTLEGSGERSKINGGQNSSVNVNSSDVTVRDISATGSKNGSIALFSDSFATSFINCSVTGANGGIQAQGDEAIVANCRVEDTGGNGIRASTNSITYNCTVKGAANTGWLVYAGGNGDNAIIANCVVTDSGNEGITYFTNDGIVIANRVDGSASNGINAGGNDIIIANNRVSNSGGDDVFDDGTGNVLDANLVT